jgi:hypothetical protein
MLNDKFMRKILALLMLVFSSIFLILISSALADMPCIHGMRIVGDQSIYLSHMGLFKSNCHDYQALFEVDFTGSNDPKNIYLNAQRSDLKKNEFTLKPKNKFELPKLRSGEIKTFNADIFEGQYERPLTKPKLIASDVTVNIKQVLYFQPFEPAAKLSSNIQYLLFGNSKEQYVAHKLTRPNDYDQILSVKTPLNLKDSELSKAVILTFPNRPTLNESDLFSKALTANTLPKPVVQINGLVPTQAIEVGSQYFREKCDYEANPPLPDQCPLSKINN